VPPAGWKGALLRRLAERVCFSVGSLPMTRVLESEGFNVSMAGWTSKDREQRERAKRPIEGNQARD
jgi:hypothetical protein